jgi:hypothetical protein
MDFFRFLCDISKVVYEYFMLKYDHNLVFPKPHRFDEHPIANVLFRQFSDALVLMIVPDYHFVHGKLWVLSTADQSHDIASEKHHDDSDAAVVEF